MRGPFQGRLARPTAFVSLAAVLFGLGVGQIGRDRVPPALYSDVPSRVAAGLPFEAFISADEPVTYTVHYGAARVEEVSQDLRLSLTAESGRVPLEIAAVDGAGNLSSLSLPIDGVPALAPRLELPATLAPGEPFSAVLGWQADDLQVTGLSFTVGTAERSVLWGQGWGRALGVVPLGTPAGSLDVRLTLEDEFGRQASVSRTVSVSPPIGGVQSLNLSSDTLSVVTPEGRRLEREALSEVFGAGEALPLWTEPFMLPIVGRGTSGFGVARRYAPGGSVSYHQGADIAAPEGTPLRATNAGVVRIADFFPISGGLVLIDHGEGVSSLYLHQSKLAVVAGQTVERGQIIGEVGSTGLSSGPHLHWEMRIAGVPTDPLHWVDRVFP